MNGFKLLIDTNVVIGLEDAQPVQASLAELVRLSAEHGIGLERKAYLSISRTPAEIATMRALKAALDPRGILNPGKVL